ncbi:MAG: hypothetical protein ONB27_13090 [candidate division KSB1 bacterium]|nr:hypothetical protein [candidate division KSB1 bacterium]
MYYLINSPIKNFLLAVIVLLSIMLNSSSVFSQRMVMGEINFEAVGIGSNDRWSADFTAQSGELRWWNDYKISTLYGSGDAGSTTGNQRISPGIDAPNSYDLSGPVVAYGIYDFTFHFPQPLGDKGFTLDLRDANWSYEGMADIYIRWNSNTNEFQYYNSLTEPYWATLGNSGSSHCIWDLFDQDTNQEVFQPAAPSDFCCTNLNQIGYCPDFEWNFPYQPLFYQDYPDNFTYNIYRKANQGKFLCVVSDLGFPPATDPLYWTDNKISIAPQNQGIKFTYYVNAETGDAPTSPPSATISIWGYYLEEKNSPKEEYEIVTANYQSQNYYLTASPNPLNPSTTINYKLPTASHATLKIFNLQGEVVKKLADRYHIANHYQVVWNGENEIG